METNRVGAILLYAALFVFSSEVLLGDVLVDNDGGEPSYSETGKWASSTSAGYRNSSYRYSTAAGASATWMLHLPQPGRYDVYAIFLASANRASNARYSISHGSQTSVVVINQCQGAGGIVQAHLGQFDFPAGTNAVVQMDTLTEGKVYVADTLLFRSGRDDPPMICPANVLPNRTTISDAVHLSAVMSDDHSIASACVLFAAPGQSTQSVRAYDDGAHRDARAGDGLFGADLPPQNRETTVSYCFRALDSLGQETSTTVQSYVTRSVQNLSECRAIWASSWGTGFLSPDEANEWVATCRQSNLNMLVPEVRKVGDAYYDSALEPRADNIKGDASFDPLKYLLMIAHDTRGGQKRLQVHAWFVMHRIWQQGPLPEGHVLLKHPEYEMLKQNGTTDAKSRWLDPGHPQVVEHNLAVVLDCLRKYDIDGVHFDYIRYPGGAEWGYNAKSVERFNAVYGRTGTPAPTDPAWCNWRRECVTLEVKKIYVKAWQLKPGVAVSADTFASLSSATYSVFQDWAQWMREGIIDYNCIMNYAGERDRATFQNQTDRACSEEHGRANMIGVGPALCSSLQGIIDQLLYARARGAAGVNIFSWRNEVKAKTPGLSREAFYAALKQRVFPFWSDPPQMTWKTAPATGIVEGNVTCQGKPLDHAQVWIEGRPETKTVSDGCGWYAILGCSPGAQTLHFSKPGCGDTQVTTQAVKAGQVLTVDASLVSRSRP